VKAPTSLERVESALKAAGLTTAIQDMPASTRTAEDAASAVGCSVGQIVKSMIFRGKGTGKPILVLTSGLNMVDPKQIETVTNESIGRPDADFVRRETGFAIGGVSPVGHLKSLDIYMDETLMEYPLVWAAAGTPNTVFAIEPDKLRQITGAMIITVTA